MITRSNGDISNVNKASERHSAKSLCILPGSFEAAVSAVLLVVAVDVGGDGGAVVGTAAVVCVKTAIVSRPCNRS